MIRTFWEPMLIDIAVSRTIEMNAVMKAGSAVDALANLVPCGPLPGNTTNIIKTPH